MWQKVEQMHAQLFSKTIESLKAKKELTKVGYFVCSVFGNTIEGQTPHRCAICGAPTTKFERDLAIS